MSFWEIFNIKKTAIKVVADSNTNNTTMKKFDFFSKVLGREVTSENLAEVTNEEWEKIDAAKAEEKPTANALTEERVQEIVSATLKNTMASAITSAVSAAIQPLQEKISELESEAGASATGTLSRDPKEIKTDPVAQANEAIEAELRAELGE